MSTSEPNYQLINFTATGTTIGAGTVTELRLTSGADIPGSSSCGDQFITVMCTSDANGGDGTLFLALADLNSASSSGEPGVIHYQTATVAVTTRRSDYDNAGGKYVCNVTFQISGKNTADLHGFENRANKRGGPRWYLGCSSLGGLTAIQAYVFKGRIT